MVYRQGSAQLPTMRTTTMGSSSTRRQDTSANVTGTKRKKSVGSLDGEKGSKSSKGNKGNKGNRVKRGNKEEGHEEHGEEDNDSEKEEDMSEDGNGYVRFHQLSGQRQRRVPKAACAWRTRGKRGGGTRQPKREETGA
jgi:hypothetical protein